MTRLARLAAALILGAAAPASAGPSAALAYTSDGKLIFPKDYRTWVYLTSGLDVAYVDAPGSGDAHVFDSVFVNREAYDAFMRTGRWPNRTVMVLENRRGQGRGSINLKGQFQTERLGVEVHVKDLSRFKSGWAFFPFRGGEAPAAQLPETSACNACHEQHGAVDTTFVQFYPTLLPRAQEMRTLAAGYLAEEQAAAQKR
jgi:hypothetical protein